MYADFTNRYKVSKTLRFKLIPQGETLRYITERGILAEDERRDAERKNVQALADAYHRRYIDRCLGKHSLEGLEEYISIFDSDIHTEGRQDALDVASAALISQISQTLTGNPEFKKLFKADLYQKILPEIYKDDKEALASLSMFDGFTTYFMGYNNVREFIYNASGDKGTIGNRLVNENLPTFLFNERRLKVIL